MTSVIWLYITAIFYLKIFFPIQLLYHENSSVLFFSGEVPTYPNYQIVYAEKTREMHSISTFPAVR